MTSIAPCCSVESVQVLGSSVLDTHLLTLDGLKSSFITSFHVLHTCLENIYPVKHVNTQPLNSRFTVSSVSRSLLDVYSVVVVVVVVVSH